MHPALFAILSKTPARKRTGLVTSELENLYRTRGPNAVSKHVQKHYTDCGIFTLKDGTEVRKPVDAGSHSLRHTAVSLMREAGAAMSVSQALVGHNSKEIHELYTHTDPEALQRAVAALPSIVDTGDEDRPADQVVIDAAPVLALVEKLPNTKSLKPIKAEILSLLKA